MEFLSRLIDTCAVVAVDDENETLSAGEVVSPKRSDLVLPANVPNVEFHVLVCYRLDVEANSRNGGYVLVKFELVEYRCALRSVYGKGLVARPYCNVLVFPAASRPSMRRRISLEPNILPIIFEIWLPMMASWALIALCDQVCVCKLDPAIEGQSRRRVKQCGIPEAVLESARNYSRIERGSDTRDSR